MTTAIPWDIDNLKISHGKHDPPNGMVNACAMEAAYQRRTAIGARWALPVLALPNVPVRSHRLRSFRPRAHRCIDSHAHAALRCM
jgi:hypothetical protein